MQIVGGELARDSEVKIACEQASYTDRQMALLVTSEIRVYCIETAKSFPKIGARPDGSQENGAALRRPRRRRCSQR